MPNYQFLNDYCNGNFALYNSQGRKLKARHNELLKEFNDTDDLEQIKLIVQKISTEIYDYLLYGNNLYYKIVLDILFATRIEHIPLCKFDEINDFPIDYYLLYNDEWTGF